MIETLANGYSSESTQQELSIAYQHGRIYKGIKNVLCSCAFDERSLSIRMVK